MVATRHAVSGTDAVPRCNEDFKRPMEDGSVKPVTVRDYEQAEAKIAEFKKQVAKRIDQLKENYEKAEILQLEAYHQNKAKLSSSIQNMTLREFYALHKVDLIERLAQVGKTAATEKPAPMAAVLETPSSKRRGRNPKTPSTVVRRRETLFEGSNDVDALVATVSKTSRSGPAFGLSMGEGTYISLSDPAGIEDMDSNTKNVAFSQLQLLQDQVASIMNKLKEAE